MLFKNSDPNTVTHVAILVVLTILRQSRRDPGIGNSTIPNPGIENSSPGLQSLSPTSDRAYATPYKNTYLLAYLLTGTLYN